MCNSLSVVCVDDNGARRPQKPEIDVSPYGYNCLNYDIFTPKFLLKVSIVHYNFLIAPKLKLFFCHISNPKTQKRVKTSNIPSTISYPQYPPLLGI